jgi:predicted DCC family thiol-disulfide oxidoreductase YuxK
MEEKNEKSIILFDGICNLCNASVQFILKHDKNENFLFASLQSDAAAKLLLQEKYKKNHLQSVVLIEEKKISDKSTAILRIARSLGGFWKLLYVFIIIPKALRDMVYDFIAKHRYQWFGKRDTCLLNIEDYKNRFI